MPVYRAKCSCGADINQYLVINKATMIIGCPSCHRGVLARQVYDKTAQFKTADGVTGIIKPGTAPSGPVL